MKKAGWNYVQEGMERMLKDSLVIYTQEAELRLCKQCPCKFWQLQLQHFWPLGQECWSIKSSEQMSVRSLMNSALALSHRNNQLFLSLVPQAHES